MKKFILIAAVVVAFTSCGTGTSTEVPVADSTAVKVDTTAPKVDTTKVKADTTKVEVTAANEGTGK